MHRKLQTQCCWRLSAQPSPAHLLCGAPLTYWLPAKAHLLERTPILQTLLLGMHLRSASLPTSPWMLQTTICCVPSPRRSPLTMAATAEGSRALKMTCPVPALRTSNCRVQT